MKPDWRNIWEKSGVFSSDPELFGDTSIQNLIALDGFHGIHGSHTVESFSKVVRDFVLACKLTPSSAVFEFGCGAGAFLKILENQNQALVGGLDYSANLLSVAKANIRAPLGLWHQEAIETATLTEEVDIAFSHSVFHYFPTTEYAKSVLRNMTHLLKSNSSSTLAILDIRDHSLKKEYLEFRSGSQGTNAKHEIGHLLYEKEFFLTQLEHLGFEEIMIVDNVPSEYGNSTYSFDVFATGLVKANLFNQ